VIPITGRPIGWCEPFLSGANTAPWPVNAMVAENGAVAYITPQPSWNGRETLSKLYQQDAALRTKNQKLMQEVAAQVMAQVPGLQLSRDSAGRETDLAFDYNEFAQLSPDTVAQVLAALRQAGMHTSVSSIHIHGCFGDFNKWQGACWIVRQCLQRDLAQELVHWVFVGDSGNDQAMFQHFTHSVGVANIRRFESQLDYLPRYITPSTHGAGFTEVANALLQARANGPTSTTIQGHA
jgi:hydroxymethylpyrimidine pyrophosphatase-like HAD family hydrolase